MKRLTRLVAATVWLLFVSCPQDTSIGELQLDFEWRKPNECSETSPAIKIDGLPEAARAVRVRLIDLYQPGADHGDWGQPIPIPAEGAIPIGGLKHFRGPCPPKYYGQSKYEFTAEALDPNGVVVARGKRAKECCPDW